MFGVGLTRTCGATYREGVDVEFSGEITWWRGPAPHHFVPMPLDVSAELREQPDLSYGWGCIPVVARIGSTRFETSLMPKDGRYLVPLRVAVRRAEDLEVGDVVTVGLAIGLAEA